ncbi:MAG: DUF6497 family protein [Paracoccus sp. (in: a-proteobacteria)]|nr:DUF6497 family protein [Paracoccus sp. (in: a-proteobacteria)]
MLALALIPAPLMAAAAPAADAVLTTPSGAEVSLQEVLTGDQGMGAIWRFRFVMPSLAERMPPMPEGEWDGITAEDAAELARLGLPAAPGPLDATAFGDGGHDDSGLVTLEELQAEGAIDNHIILTLPDEPGADLPSVPADPDVLLQDPQHADIVWLCETVALPMLPPKGAAGRPAQIVISLSDRATAFGEIDPEAVQLFEGFSPSDDNQFCLWEPW